MFLQAVNQISERKHDVFQIITEDDKVLFCSIGFLNLDLN